MRYKQINVVSPVTGEGAGFDVTIEAKSFARLLAARLREVMAAEENRRAADAWKFERALESQMRRSPNEQED